MLRYFSLSLFSSSPVDYIQGRPFLLLSTFLIKKNFFFQSIILVFCKRVKKIESHRAGSIDDDEKKMSISMHGQFYLLYCIFSIFIPFFSYLILSREFRCCCFYYISHYTTCTFLKKKNCPSWHKFSSELKWSWRRIKVILWTKADALT